MEHILLEYTYSAGQMSSLLELELANSHRSGTDKTVLATSRDVTWLLSIAYACMDSFRATWWAAHYKAAMDDAFEVVDVTYADVLEMDDLLLMLR